MSSFKTNLYLKIVFQLTVFYFFSATSEVYPNILIKENEDNNQEVACILKILQKYVPCNNFISVVVSAEIDSWEVIKKINEDTCYSVTLKSSDENHSLIWTETYVVLTTKTDELSSILSHLANNLHWNPRARFIIYTNETNNDDIKHMFKVLLARHIYNVVILSWNGNDVIIQTYFPFGNGRCGRRFEDIINLGVCATAADSSDLFSNNNNDYNTKNCAVRLVLHEDVPCVLFKSSNFTIFGKHAQGIEQYLLETVRHRENLTYKYKLMSSSENIGIVSPNRTVTGIFAYLQGGMADVAAGCLILTKNRGDVFDYVWGYNYDHMSLYTPVLESKSWKNIFKALGPKTWTLTIILYCLVGAISISIATLYPEINQERFLLIFKLWGFFFQGNTDKSLLKVKKLRLLLCFWIWLTFFITNFYNTAMFSMVTSQIGIKGTFDIEDLDHLPFKPCISENIRILFASAYNQNLPESVASPKCRYISSSLTEVGTRKDLYTLCLKQNYNLRAHEFTDFRGQSTIDVWEFSNACVPVLYIRKGYPLREKLEKYATLMYEAGLMQKHIEALSFKSQTAIMKKSKSFIRVRLQYLKIHFYLLGVALLVSTTVFLFELMVKKCFDNTL